MNILVTGGAGFIGSRLTKKLVEKGHSVVQMDNLIDVVHAGKEPETIQGATLFCGDVARSEDWDNVLSTTKPDVVFHLAAETGTGTSLAQPTLHANTNVNGTAQLIEQLQKHDCVPQRILLSSSRAVYGEGAYLIDGVKTYAPPRLIEHLETGHFDIENADGSPAEFLGHNASVTFPQPTNVYASTKLAQEHLLRNYCSAFNVSLHIQRFQNVYGQGQALNNPYTGILVWFMNAALKNEKIFVYENGGIVRDFVHVDDVVSALLLSLDSDLPEFLGDIGSGTITTIEDVAAEIVSVTNSNSTIEYCDKFRLGDVRKAYAVIDDAKNQLGYTPHVSLREGLEQFAQWASSQND